MSFNPISGNPILDAWLAAWTNGLNLSTQLSSAWLGGQRSNSNPWAALTGALTGGMGGSTGAGWPMASLAGAGAANPWAAFGGAANNPFASLAGLQSLMSLAMAPWSNLGGGSTPQMGSFPFPWNASPWNAGNTANSSTWGGMGGWPMTVGFPGMPGMSAPMATPALPWPWNQFFPPQQSAGPSAFGWPPGVMGPLGGARQAAPAAVENDPMGFGQAMKFWSSLMPAAAPAGPSRASKPEPVAASAPTAPDLTKLFPWMAWMK